MTTTTRAHSKNSPKGSARVVRKVVYLIHLWVGLILGAYFALMGLSGSTLVFKTEINKVLSPHLYTVTPVETKPLTLSRVAEIFKVAHPQEEISSLLLPLKADDPLIIGYKSIQPGPEKSRPHWRQCFINQYSGVITGDEANGGIFNIVQRLHFRLLLDKQGENLNRWGSLVIITMLISGLWLWWPAASRFWQQFKQRTTIKSDGSFKRIVFDTHNAVGFYSSSILLVLALTAASHFFKDQTIAIVSTLTATPLEKKEKRPPAVKSKLTFDQIVERARAAAPDMVPYIVLDSLRVKMVKKNEPPVAAQFVTVVLNAQNETSIVERPEAEPLGRQILNWLMPVHFGQWGGPLYYPIKILWFFAGLCPTVLFLSGCIMYIERRRIKLNKKVN
jgi:uncharacterized iron-regulated membrane protein